MMKNNKKMEHKSYLYCKVIKTHKDINVSASRLYFKTARSWAIVATSSSSYAPICHCGTWPWTRDNFVHLWMDSKSTTSLL